MKILLLTHDLPGQLALEILVPDVTVGEVERLKLEDVHPEPPVGSSAMPDGVDTAIGLGMILPARAEKTRHPPRDGHDPKMTLAGARQRDLVR